VTTVPAYTHQPNIEGTLDSKLWDDPRAFEMELHTRNK
jgi:hypothetical protein